LSTASFLAALVLAQATPQASPPPAPVVPAPPAAPATPAPAAKPAASSAAQPKVLTLREAIESARKQNLDIQQLDARVEQARQLAWKAWSTYLPQVNAGVQVARNQYEV
jgi:outer membrane protein TolC